MHVIRSTKHVTEDLIVTIDFDEMNFIQFSFA